MFLILRLAFELKELIESVIKDDDERTLGEKCYIYFWRAFINIIILGAMGGLGFLTYYMLENVFDNLNVSLVRFYVLPNDVSAITF